MGILWDVRHSLRLLWRHPGHAAIVIATLALGIAGSAAIFSFVDGVLLRPLPHPEPGNLVVVCETHPERDATWCGASPANLLDWRRDSRSLETIGLGRTWPFGLKDEGGAFEGVAGGVATWGMFDAFRVQPALGRLFVSEDHDPGRDHVAILSHGLWQDRFGSDPQVVGRAINLDEETYFVIGVLPAGFEVPYLEEVELWIPLWSDRVNWRGWRGLRPYARLADGHSLEEARAELRTIADRLSREYPDTNKGWTVRVERLQDRMVASVRPALLIFLGAVGFVLLIACANAANLVLARATGREREFAIRTALGAGPARMIRSLLTDSLVLALLGGAVGVLLAQWLVSLFVGLAPAGFPRLEEVGLSGGVLLFALALSAVTSVLFGLLPAWQSSRVDPNGALKEGRQAGASGRGNRARDLLVVAEVSLTLILLVGAGLLMRSFLNLTDWQPGFETERVITFSVFPPLGKYPRRENLEQLYLRTNERLTALPGVISAGEVSAGPLFGGGDGVAEFSIEGRPVPPEGEYPTVAWFDCGPDYFRTMGIALRQGRYFTGADRPGATPVAIVNETMARRHWPGGGAVGARVHLRGQDLTLEIVGVVSDVEPFDPRESIQPMIYWPLRQQMRGATFYAVRAAIDPATVIPAIRAALEEVEPEMSVAGMTTLEERIGRQLVRPRFHMLLLGIFSGLAFVIAMIGVYGVISYAVAQRTHEFGVRVALGAHRRHVLGMVLRKGLLLALAGIGLGSLGAIALTRFLESLLVEVTPTDPATFAAVAASVLAVSLLASCAPARRATRIDPVVALREE